MQETKFVFIGKQGKGIETSFESWMAMFLSPKETIELDMTNGKVVGFNLSYLSKDK